jgi:general stress protein 26
MFLSEQFCFSSRYVINSTSLHTVEEIHKKAPVCVTHYVKGQRYTSIYNT